jgi:hypothetical protein
MRRHSRRRRPWFVVDDRIMEGAERRSGQLDELAIRWCQGKLASTGDVLRML